jgi:hypothetical protein
MSRSLWSLHWTAFLRFRCLFNHVVVLVFWHFSRIPCSMFRWLADIHFRCKASWTSLGAPHCHFVPWFAAFHFSSISHIMCNALREIKSSFWPFRWFARWTTVFGFVMLTSSFYVPCLIFRSIDCDWLGLRSAMQESWRFSHAHCLTFHRPFLSRVIISLCFKDRRRNGWSRGRTDGRSRFIVHPSSCCWQWYCRVVLLFPMPHLSRSPNLDLGITCSCEFLGKHDG